MSCFVFKRSDLVACFAPDRGNPAIEARKSSDHFFRGCLRGQRPEPRILVGWLPECAADVDDDDDDTDVDNVDNDYTATNDDAANASVRSYNVSFYT